MGGIILKGNFEPECNSEEAKTWFLSPQRPQYVGNLPPKVKGGKKMLTLYCLVQKLNYS